MSKDFLLDKISLRNLSVENKHVMMDSYVNHLMMNILLAKRTLLFTVAKMKTHPITEEYTAINKAIDILENTVPPWIR